MGTDNYSACRFDRRQIAVVTGRKDDDFVARPNKGGKGGKQSLRSAGGNSDFLIDVVTHAIDRLNLVGNCRAQLRRASHWRILVAPGTHRPVCGLEQGRIGLKVREALRQVDRPAIGRQLGHHGKNGRPDVGKLGVDFQILILVHTISLTLPRQA